jgi:hypothetical protein
VTTGDTDVAVTGNSITTVVEIDFFVEDNDTVTCGDVASTLVDKLEIVIALGFNGKSTVSEGIGEDIENRGVVVTLKRNSLVGGTKVTFSVIFGRDDSIEYGIRVDGIICRVIVRLVAIIIVVEDNDTVTCGDVASTLVARTLKTGELWSLQNVIHLLRYL